ncbi:DUF3289 family protein [Kaarinaea lacus]
MGGCRIPGSAGGLTNNLLIDPNTNGPQTAFTPGITGNRLFAVQPTACMRPVVVGKAKRDPGFNFDGTPAEDMMYADHPKKAASLKNDPVFALPDSTLNAYMKQLMESLSVGDMEKVALEMQARFAKGVGGTYKSSILDAEIANHETFVTYHNAFLKELKAALKKSDYDLFKMSTLSMNLLNFSSFWDKVTGLGITVHQVWSAKAELENYRLDCQNGLWIGELVYTFYDHYGLDWEDIVKHGDDKIPQYHTGDFFKAWYILQHFRTAKPFITQMQRKVFVSGKVVW